MQKLRSTEGKLLCIKSFCVGEGRALQAKEQAGVEV